MYLLRLGCQQQSGRRHIQPVHDKRSGSLGVEVVQPLEDGIEVVLARYGKHARRLVYYHQPFVLVENFQCRLPVYVLFQRIRFDLQSHEHVFQNRFTLPLARRIEMPLAAYLVLGRHAPPELAHGQGLEMMQVRILEQFGQGTFPRSGRRRLLRGTLENLAQVFHLAPGVEHPELGKQPQLESRRACFPFVAQGLNLLVESLESLSGLLYLLLQPPFQSLELRFLELAFARHRFRLFGRNPFLPPLFPTGFFLFQFLFLTGQCGLGLFFRLLPCLPC